MPIFPTGQDYLHATLGLLATFSAAGCSPSTLPDLPHLCYQFSLYPPLLPHSCSTLTLTLTHHLQNKQKQNKNAKSWLEHIILRSLLLSWISPTTDHIFDLGLNSRLPLLVLNLIPGMIDDVMVTITVFSN